MRRLLALSTCGILYQEKGLINNCWILVNNFKFIPLQKLLSAWRNKFSVDSKGVAYAKKYGETISKYRSNNTYDSPKHTAPFEPFVRFVSRDPWQNNHLMNTHWLPSFDSCSPCGMDYDFVVQQENSEPDSNFVLQRAQLENVTYLPPQYGSSPLLSATLNSWYANVTSDTLKDLYRAYFADFLLFDYDIDMMLWMYSSYQMNQCNWLRLL